MSSNELTFNSDRRVTVNSSRPPAKSVQLVHCERAPLQTDSDASRSGACMRQEMTKVQTAGPARFRFTLVSVYKMLQNMEHIMYFPH